MKILIALLSILFVFTACQKDNTFTPSTPPPSSSPSYANILPLDSADYKPVVLGEWKCTEVLVDTSRSSFGYGPYLGHYKDISSDHLPAIEQAVLSETANDIIWSFYTDGQSISYTQFVMRIDSTGPNFGLVGIDISGNQAAVEYRIDSVLVAPGLDTLMYVTELAPITYAGGFPSSRPDPLSLRLEKQ